MEYKNKMEYKKYKEYKIIIPFDKNPRYNGLINFASKGVEDEYSAFQYGFGLGWQTC